MDRVTQQNAAGAEQNAAASEELSAQAEKLSAIVLELANIVGKAAGVDALGVKPSARPKSARLLLPPSHQTP